MKYSFKPYSEYQEFPVEEMKQRSFEFYQQLKARRTIRDFSSRTFPVEIIKDCIRAAGTAPNGANKQPWHFVVIQNAALKKEIRIAAEKEEEEFYNHRASEQWLKDLLPFGTDENKPFLEKAPYLIVIFEQKYTVDKDGEREQHYYSKESVGIATGMLITALHHAGLAMLTHTPSPMKFLNKILNRPSYEKPFLLLVVGYPEDAAEVPDISKKELNEIATFL